MAPRCLSLRLRHHRIKIADATNIPPPQRFKTGAKKTIIISNNRDVDTTRAVDATKSNQPST